MCYLCWSLEELLSPPDLSEDDVALCSPLEVDRCFDSGRVGVTVSVDTNVSEPSSGFWPLGGTVEVSEDFSGSDDYNINNKNL